MSSSMDTQKDSKEENDDLVERMTNNEFRQFLPYLDLDEILLTEIYLNGHWSFLITKGKRAKKRFASYCHACCTRVPSSEVIYHLGNKDHIESLKKVEQFFHPAFTYLKEAARLMKGEKVSAKDLKVAIGLANSKCNQDSFNCTVANEFAKFIRETMAENSLNYWKVLEKLALNHPIKDHRHMFVTVSLPLLTLLNVEYKGKNEKWLPMLTAVRPHPNSRYQCKLCDSSFEGIKNLVLHLSQVSHKQKQLECLEVRCKIYDFLTKNCVFRYGSRYLLVVNNKAQNYFKKEIVEELRKLGDTDNKEAMDNTFQLDEVPQSILQKGEALRIRRELNLEVVDERENQPKIEKMKESYPSTKAMKYDGQLVIKNDGLVGVEYVIRILKSKRSTIKYVCTLCDKTLSEELMAEHLIGYTHRMKYFNSHYPDTTNGYKNKMGHMKYPNFLRVFGLVLAKLASALEAYHGYGSVKEVPALMFNNQEHRLIEEAINRPHASQDRGPSFLNAISNNELKEYIANQNLYVSYTVDHETPARFCLRSEKKYLGERRERDRVSKSLDKLDRRSSVRSRTISRSPIRKRSPSRVRIRNRDRSRSRTRTRSRSRTHSPRRSSRRKRSLSPKGRRSSDIWSKYRLEVSKLASDIENKYMKYRKFPENYPYYENEWNIFWKKRKEELMRQGIDHRGYDFQSEWIHYFKQRLEIFFGEELHQAQIEVRRRLNIPLDAEEDTPNIGHGGKRSRMEEPAKWHGAKEEPLDVLPKWPTDNKPNVIHVLRLLTAFEDHLGSVGAKVMDLLTKALLLEKSFANDPLKLEASILTASNCSIIETAAEKLKGLLFAGLLEKRKINSFKSIIEYASDLLKHAEKMGYRREISKEPTGLQQILGAAQEKSLSDTLLELITSQKDNIKSDATSMVSNQGDYRNQSSNRKDDVMYKNKYQPSGGYRNSVKEDTIIHNTSYRSPNNYNTMNDQSNNRYNQKKGHAENGASGSNQMGRSGFLNLNTNLSNNKNSGDMEYSFESQNMFGSNVGPNNFGYNMANNYLAGTGNSNNRVGWNYNNKNNINGANATQTSSVGVSGSGSGSYNMSKNMKTGWDYNNSGPKTISNSSSNNNLGTTNSSTEAYRQYSSNTQQGRWVSY